MRSRKFLFSRVQRFTHTRCGWHFVLLALLPASAARTWSRRALSPLIPSAKVPEGATAATAVKLHGYSAGHKSKASDPSSLQLQTSTDLWKTAMFRARQIRMKQCLKLLLMCQAMQAFVMVTPMVHVNTLPAALGEGRRSVCKVNADVSLDIVPLVASVFSMYQRKICYNAHNAPVALAAGLGIATSTAAQLAAWMVSACANQVPGTIVFLRVWLVR